MQQDHTIFLHIPKTAGTTLIKILRKQYGRRKTFSIYGNPTSVAADSFCALSQKTRDKYRLLQGHWPYGMHEKFSGETRYISIMREPVGRLISEYYYILRTPYHYLHSTLVNDNVSLDEFLTSDLTIELDNSQLRLIAGCEKNIPFGGITSKHLDLAKKHIKDKFFVVGLMSHFDETLLLYKKYLGWKQYPYYHRRNVTAPKKKTGGASEESLKKIRERNSHECQLYEWVQEHFFQQLHEGGADFESELKRFQRNNELYQRWTIDLRKPKWLWIKSVGG